MDLATYTADLIGKIRTTAPLVHNITNYVAMNSSANMLLAVGGLALIGGAGLLTYRRRAHGSDS